MERIHGAVIDCTLYLKHALTLFPFVIISLYAILPPMIRYFNEFLMAHSHETAEQVRSEYMDTMGKMYYSYFKDYHSKLMKLQVCTSA